MDGGLLTVLNNFGRMVEEFRSLSLFCFMYTPLR